MHPNIASKRQILTRFSVDRPQQGEKVTSGRYAIRVSAPERSKAVEVCIDQGPWQACRHSAGYWWRDWSGYADGEHEICARIKTHDGQLISSEGHEFFVDREPHESEANA